MPLVTPRRWHAVTLAALLALVPGGVAAQPGGLLLDQYFSQGLPGTADEAGTTVQSRARPQYDPLGVRLGSFVIRPAVAESFGYNSNLLGQRPARGTAEADTQGGIAVASDWGRNRLGAAISFDDRRALSLPAADRTDWSVAVGGMYQLGRDTLTLAGSHAQAHQEPVGVDAVQVNLPAHYATAPIPYTVDTVAAGYTRAFARFDVTPAFGYQRLRYGALHLVSLGAAPVPTAVAGSVLGQPVDQGYRDRDLLQGSITGRYEFAPLRDGLVVLRETGTDYVAATRDAFGRNRNGTATELLAGLDYAASGLWRYRALLGYEVRDFQNYRSHDAPVAEASVVWQPGGMTTLTARLRRSIEDAADENVSGYDYSLARLTLDREAARDILLTGSLAFQRADYLDSRNSESFYSGGAGVTWLVDRAVRVGVSYDLTDRQGSKGFGSDYRQSIALLTLRLGY